MELSLKFKLDGYWPKVSVNYSPSDSSVKPSEPTELKPFAQLETAKNFFSKAIEPLRVGCTAYAYSLIASNLFCDLTRSCGYAYQSLHGVPGSILVGSALAYQKWSQKTPDQPPVFTDTTPKKIAKSAFSGVNAFIATGAPLVSAAIGLGIPPEPFARDFILGASVLAAITSFARTFSSQQKPDASAPTALAQTPDTVIIPSVEKDKILSPKVVQSFLFGLKAYSYSLLAGAMLTSARDVDIPPLAVGSSLIGAASALWKFSKSTPDQPPTPTDNTLTKVAKSVFAGFNAGLSTFMPLLTGAILTHPRIPADIVFGAPVLAAFASAVITYSSLTKSDGSVPDPKQPNQFFQAVNRFLTALEPLRVGCTAYGYSWLAAATYCDFTKSCGPYYQNAHKMVLGSALIGSTLALRKLFQKTPDQSVPTDNILKKIAKSAFSGVNAVIATGFPLVTVSEMFEIRPPEELVLGSIALAALTSFARTFSSLTKRDGAPSVPNTPVVKYPKIEGARAGILGGMIATVLSSAIVKSLDLDPTPSRVAFVCSTTALAAIASFTRSYSPVAWSRVANYWKGLSKKKKVAILITLGSGAATLLVGPEVVAGKVGAAHAEAQQQFLNAVYTTTTKTETKSSSEWIKFFDDNVELFRLAALSKNEDLNEISCAEILNTCDLDETAPDHKKIVNAKMLKFHPDGFQNASKEDKDLVTDASAVLSQALMTIRKQKKCPGKGSDACTSMLNDPVNMDLKSVRPHWLYEKITGAEHACFIAPEGEELEPASRHYCSNLSL